MTPRVRLLSGPGRSAAPLLLMLLLLPAAVPALWGQGCGFPLSASDQRTYNNALEHYGQRRFKQAAQQMRKVAARNPSVAAPQFWLGMISASDGFNVAGIRRYFSRCIGLCPDYPAALAHYYMGLVHYTDARYDSAVAELDKYFLLVNTPPQSSPADPSGLAAGKAATAVYQEASNYLHWSRFLAEAELNTVPFEPHRLKGVSSSYDEALPYITLDGSECFFLRRQPVSRPRTYYARELDEPRWQLCRSAWADSQFTSGAPLPAPFNGGSPEGSVSLTADGSELYYSVITPAGSYANSDIYRVCRHGGRWGEAERLGCQINSPQSWESQPFVSPDGQHLYFASNRKGGYGGIDIWCSHRLPNGDWSRPSNLGPAVNTPGNDKAPFLAADGQTLYFLSDGWQGFGGYDIYLANLADRFANRPTNLGLPINTEADAVSFGVSTDGRRAYFAGRTDSSRSTDILVFDLYPAARPEPMRLHRIKMAVADTLRDTVVLLSLRRPSTVVLWAEGMLPCILLSRPNASLPTRVELSDSVAVLPIPPAVDGSLTPEAELVVDALGRWMSAHSCVCWTLEYADRGTMQAVCERLKLSHGDVGSRISTVVPRLSRPQIRCL